MLTNKERHPPSTNSPVYKTILTERPRAAVFLGLFRNNLLPFDPDLESIEDGHDGDYDDEVDDDDDDVDEVLVGITGVEDSSSQEDHSEGRGNCNCTECSDSE